MARKYDIPSRIVGFMLYVTWLTIVYITYYKIIVSQLRYVTREEGLSVSHHKVNFDKKTMAHFQKLGTMKNSQFLFDLNLNQNR